MATVPSEDLNVGSTSRQTNTDEVSYTEALRETIVYSEVFHMLDAALAVMGVDHLTLLIEEGTSIPTDLRPFIAES